MTESGRKPLCACGCGRNVTRVTELRHQQGKGPSTLASAILAQNSTLKGRHRKWKLAHQSVKHQLVGCHAPIRNALNASHSHAPSHDISGHFLDNDYLWMIWMQVHLEFIMIHLCHTHHPRYPICRHLDCTLKGMLYLPYQKHAILNGLQSMLIKLVDNSGGLTILWMK